MFISHMIIRLASTTPAWIKNNYTKINGETILGTDIPPNQTTFDIWKGKNLASGTISLGDNNGVTQSSMYFVFYKSYEALSAHVKVFLQGPYSGKGMMNTTINGLIPTSQPYSGSPWNYAGSESYSVPSDAVDWVLVQLRTGTAASTAIRTRAAFLMSDGSIHDIDGSDHVNFIGLSTGSYYIVVIHRNHLAIMSANAVNLPNNSGSAYDFTTAQTQAYGTNSMKDLGSGVYGMWTGDADGNGQIQNSDKNSYWQVQVGLAGYQSADFDLNGQVQNNDKNSYWSVNVGLGTQVP